MPLAARQKQELYHQLAQLLESGHALASSLELLRGNASGKLRETIGQIGERLRGGATFSEAMAGFSPLEIALIVAGEKSGRLPSTLEQLSRHFGLEAEFRADLWRRSAYPLLILHLAAVTLALPKFVGETGGWLAFLGSALPALLIFYAAAVLLALLVSTLKNLATRDPAVDRALFALPLIGPMRRDFALSRFATVYELLLSAGGNIFETLTHAGRATGSAQMQATTQKALAAVHAGQAPLPILAIDRLFRPLAQTLTTGQETGRLDEELERVSAELEKVARVRIAQLGEILPRAFYFLVVIFVGIRIIQTYAGVLQSYQKLMDF